MPRSVFARFVTAALLLVPNAAHAQLTRAWDLCFTSGVLSCTQLTLVTTPQLAGGVRVGTLFDLVLSYRENSPWRSALQDVSLGFAPAATDLSVSGPASYAALDPLGATTPAAAAQLWAQTVSSDPVDAASSFVLLTSHPSTLGLAEGAVGYVGGCGVAGATGAIDAFASTPLWTCGVGSAYHTSFTSLATLDADRVTSLGVDVYRAYAGGLPLAPFCVAQTDGSGSVGTAEGDFSDFGDVCSVRALGAPSTVPEPPSSWLLAIGLVIVLFAARHRARAAV